LERIDRTDFNPELSSASNHFKVFALFCLPEPNRSNDPTVASLSVQELISNLLEIDQPLPCALETPGVSAPLQSVHLQR
jgi:hypothetical protein